MVVLINIRILFAYVENVIEAREYIQDIKNMMLNFLLGNLYKKLSVGDLYLMKKMRTSMKITNKF